MNGCGSLLLVEDDAVDAMIVKRALLELKISNPLHVVSDGEEALAFLKVGREKPRLILLDLNMPRMNGLEFLRKAKQNDATRRIPVVILTTSKAEQDKRESFNLGAAGYMVKPLDYSGFIEIMKAIHAYWSYSETPEE